MEIKLFFHAFYYISFHQAKITHQLSSCKLLPCFFFHLSIQLYSRDPTDDLLFVNSPHSKQALLKESGKKLDNMV
jgi:hypothetical protein